MKHSEQLAELADALAQAQGEIDTVERNCVNPFFKSKYADLAACRAAVKGPLSRHGLSIVQGPTIIPNGDTMLLGLTTRLLHKSGQWIETECGCPAGDAKPQSLGSAITYLRRYCLCAMTNLAADDDDDGNHAQQTAGQQKAKSTKAATAPPSEKADADDPTAKARRSIEKCVVDRNHELLIKGWNAAKKNPNLKAHGKDIKTALMLFLKTYADDAMGLTFLPALVEGKVITSEEAASVADSLTLRQTVATSSEKFKEMQEFDWSSGEMRDKEEI